MSYIQITTRCNMLCPHCCFACTREGEDMSFETFIAAIKFTGTEVISIGGGEPTVHPQFWKFMRWMRDRCSQGDSIWMATNGKRTKTALRLFDEMHSVLWPEGVLQVCLSTDQYHDKVDERVYKAFNEHTRFVEEKYIVKAGRANWGNDDCPCDRTFIKPSGDIHLCGCADAPKLGNVHTYFDLGEYEDYVCIKEYKRDRRRTEQDQGSSGEYIEECNEQHAG